MFRLMAFVLVLSGLGLGSAARADQAEDEAVAFVKKLGGQVTRDKNGFGEVVTVTYLSEKMTNAGLKELAPLKNLTSLSLAHTRVTDAGLGELAPLKNLTSLSLHQTQVTDALFTRQ